MNLLGALVFKEKIITYLGLNEGHNSSVDTYLSYSGLFYGITLGLIAVSTFENFRAAEEKVNNECGSLSALYRDVSTLAKPEKFEMQQKLQEYVVCIINEAWPLQQKGLASHRDAAIMDSFHIHLADYMPESDHDKIIYAEVFSAFNTFVLARRQRLSSVNISLPNEIYFVLFLGALITIILTWCLVISNKKLNILYSILSALLIGSLVFLIVSMDNPFRGEFSVKVDPFQLLLDKFRIHNTMNPF
jgi:hypothetical protein